MHNFFVNQLAMYSAYHRSIANRLTHYIGVPVILFSLIVLAALVPAGELVGMPFSLATVLAVALAMFYLGGWRRIGLIAVFVLLVMVIAARFVVAEGTGHALTVFAVCFVGGWALQFLGHVFEGRRPALFDNLIQVLMAPAFMIAELLFAFGQEPKLKAEIRKRQSKYTSQSISGGR